MKEGGAEVVSGRSTVTRRVVAADAVWDVVLGVACVLVAVPAGARAFGVSVSWALTVVLVVLGLGSVGYGATLARASRSEDAARAICPPTAVANAVGAVALVVVTVVMSAGLTVLGVAVLAVAAVGCAVFAGAEGVLAWRGSYRSV